MRNLVFRIGTVLLLGVLLSQAAVASETVFATKLGGLYTLSSAEVVSPFAWRDSYAEAARVSCGEDVIVRASDGGDFTIRVFGPDRLLVDWQTVPGSFVFRPEAAGGYRFIFGRTGSWVLEDFYAVPTDPPGALIPDLRQDIENTARWARLPRKDHRQLQVMLQRAELQLRHGNRVAEIRALQAFMSKVSDLQSLGMIKWAKGQYWINAANYVIEQIRDDEHSPPKADD